MLNGAARIAATDPDSSPRPSRFPDSHWSLTAALGIDTMPSVGNVVCGGRYPQILLPVRATSAATSVRRCRCRLWQLASSVPDLALGSSAGSASSAARPRHPRALRGGRLVARH